MIKSRSRDSCSLVDRMVKLLVLLCSALFIFVKSSSFLECRILGLDHFLKVLESRSNFITDGHTVKWIVMAKRSDLLDRFMPFLEGTQLYEFLKASFYYFPPEVQSKIMREIQTDITGKISERTDRPERSFKEIFLSNLSRSLIHQYTLADYAGEIKRFPNEVLDFSCTYLGPALLINLASTCWYLHDHLAPKCRDRLCIFDPKGFNWRLSVPKIYKSWLNASFDKDGTRLFLEKNLNVSLLRGPLFFSEQFSSVEWDQHHGSHRLFFRRNGATLNDWIKEQHQLIPREIFETILLSDLGNQVSWSTFESLVGSECCYQKLEVLLERMMLSCEFDENLPYRVYKNGCPTVLCLRLIHHLAKRDSTLNSKNLEILFKKSQNPDSIVKILIAFKTNLLAKPSHATLEILFTGIYKPDFLRLFFRKLYPTSQIDKDLLPKFRSLNLPTDLLHTITLLCSDFRPKLDVLTVRDDIEVDLFMAIAVKSTEPMPMIIVEAMRRKYPETHIKILLRLCAPALKYKFIDEIIAAASQNGYTEDFCNFLQAA